MNLDEKLENMKEMHKILIDFIESEENIDEIFNNLQELFDDQKIKNNKYDLISLLQLISKIANNHYRVPLFFDKIEKILMFFKDDIKKFLSNSEIFNIFKKNKRIILFLIEEKIIILDEYIVKIITNGKYESMKYPQYFQPEIKPFINEEWFKETHKKDGLIEEINKEMPDYFNESRKLAENDDFICTLIRNDSVEEFIQYMNKKNYSFKSAINQSIYETNSFLIKKGLSYQYKYIPKLIDYAAFYGSIQIFQFLMLNNVDLNPSIWLYAIHGNKPEIIHLLEENNVIPADDTYMELYAESIKYHHNDIANYFKNNFLKNVDELKSFTCSLMLEYHNISFADIDLYNQLMFFFACKFDYPSFVEQYFATTDIDPNYTINFWLDNSSSNPKTRDVQNII